MDALIKRLHAALAALVERGYYGTIDGRLDLSTRVRWEGPAVDWYATWDGYQQGYGLSPEEALEDLIIKLEGLS